MNKKVVFLTSILVVLTFLLASCSGLGMSRGDKEKAFEDTHKKYMDLTSYKANANVTYVANNKEMTFLTAQAGDMNGRYRIEIIEPENVAGSTTVSDGKTIYQFNERVSKDVYITTKESVERVEILITSFLRNYKQSDSVSVVSNLDEGLYTVLEANISGEHPLISSEKLWINNKTLLPEKLVVYDKNNLETIKVEYVDFEYNPNLDNSIFQVNVK